MDPSGREKPNDGGLFTRSKLGEGHVVKLLFNLVTHGKKLISYIFFVWLGDL
jgi:hypothetical protein